ncbi:hypothetical protein [Bacillus sp. JJ722]|uniref:hypothetical protein n=1 Tax=Bacillus sp. JJ722 TaxID=3122973 RepID=UPI002FFD6941
MKQALVFAIEPTNNVIELSTFLNIFGKWVIEESNQWLQKNNPNRKKQLILS